MFVGLTSCKTRGTWLTGAHSEQSWSEVVIHLETTTSDKVDIF